MINHPEIFDEEIFENAKAFGAAVILKRKLLISAQLPMYASGSKIGHENAQEIVERIKDDLNRSITSGPNQEGEYEGITDALENLLSLQEAERNDILNPIAYEKLLIDKNNVNYLGEDECTEWMAPLGIEEWGNGGNYFCVLDKDNPADTDLVNALNCSTFRKCLIFEH